MQPSLQRQFDEQRDDLTTREVLLVVVPALFLAAAVVFLAIVWVTR